MEKFRVRWSPRGGFNSTRAVTGDNDNTIYAGLNMILRGDPSSAYLEQWTGYGLFAASGNNTLATGTVALTVDVSTVVGTGTRFLSELVPGQSLAINGRVFVPVRIISDTSMEVAPKAHATVSGQPIALLQQIQALDTVILTLIRGSVIRLPLGHLLGVGRGQVRRNGVVLPGAGLTLRDQPQLAVYNPGADSYTGYPLGMVTPTLVTLTAVAAGTKMVATNYSVRLVPAKTATNGWNNPSNPISVTLAANQRVQVTFPAMDTTNGQDAWKVYVTQSTSGASVASALQGPWYDYGRLITTADVASGGGNVTLEWADAEVSGNDQLEFDNDPAPSAGFVTSLGGLPILISCNGPGRTLTGTAATAGPGSNVVTGTGTSFLTELAINRYVWINNLPYRVLNITSATSMTVFPTPLGTVGSLPIRSGDESPGPTLRPAKATVGGYNFEAYPARSGVSIDPPDLIIGYYQARQRIYLLTANSLNIAEASGDPDVPLVTSSFWNVGFRNPRALAFANGYLYAYTTNGATRSAEFGDKVETEHTFAAPVASIMALWDPAKVTVAYSAQFEAVCFMHADDGTRPGGSARYGTMLVFNLRLGVWGPPLRMEDLDDVDPTYATSTATVQGRMFFASPTNLGVMNIYELAVTNGEVGETFVASPFIDLGAEGFDKNIRGLTLTAGRSNAAPVVAGIYGSLPNGALPLSDFNLGQFASSGAINFTVDTPVVTTFRAKLYTQRLRVFSVRVRLAQEGSVGARLDEVVVDGNYTKFRY